VLASLITTPGINKSENTFLKNLSVYHQNEFRVDCKNIADPKHIQLCPLGPVKRNQS